MNNTICQATNKTPYEIVFGMHPHSNIAWMEHLFKEENCIDEEQLLENINVEQEDTSLDFEEENDENEDNNSNSIHDKHQSKSRNTKSLNKNSKNKGKQKQVTFAVNNNQNKESDYNHYNNDLNKDSDNFNEDSDDLNKDTDDSNEDSDDFNEDANNFNENSDDSNKDSDDFNEDHANNLNEDSDDFDENSEDFNDLRSNFNKNKNIKKQPKPKQVSNVDSSTLFQLKPPQIKNITWEEINASWEGMFGYSNKLRLGVIKRDILGCLRDLKAMRKTNSFDNILLNIWEKKFNKWLDELDNEQNSETIEASTSHDYIREDAKMNNKKYRDDMKILMEKKVKKKDLFKVGDIVNLKIPKADKGKLGHSHLPCKILQVKSNGFYNLGCFAGTLNVNYKGNCLESTELTSMAELTNIPNKVVTVTEAVRLQSNINSVKCKCPNTNCSTMKCACKKLNLSCNIRCHPGKTCHNPSL
ncbi:KRAB-A domain-containing protein 2-like [Rhizophagus irregularis DAOM 181602=DAOM 197198]|nr:KRAB-A domain-containing protein 2-like [Rhizophagus irregularis DAOM 181602=DAOM 197198]